MEGLFDTEACYLRRNHHRHQRGVGQQNTQVGKRGRAGQWLQVWTNLSAPCFYLPHRLRALTPCTSRRPLLRLLKSAPCTYRELELSQSKGDVCNASILKLSVHVGTHIDSPGHFINKCYEEGLGVESLDLYVLNGPVLVIQVPLQTNITGVASPLPSLPFSC
jgi:hypothetical protein